MIPRTAISPLSPSSIAAARLAPEPAAPTLVGSRPRAEPMDERPIRIGINARLLTTPEIRGWNRYTINLLAELPARGAELVLYSTGPIDPSYLVRLPEDSTTVVVREGLRRADWEHRWLPRRCRLDRIDVFHSPFNFGLPWSAPCPRVLTLHDAIFHLRRDRSAWPSFKELVSRLDHWIARTRTDRLIAVSEHVRGDLVSHLHIPPEKITVIGEAGDPRFHRPIAPEDRSRVRAKYSLPARYIFYVGGWESRKNIPFLIRGFAAAGLGDVSVVLAGGSPEERAPLAEMAAGLGVGDRLLLLGRVADEDLPALYAEALTFAYPSEYEGFGLQLCEAMAVGCPVLAARATCLPEVLGSGGDTFTLDDPAELAGLLRRVADEPGYRDELRRRASERSPFFSWSKTADETMALYRSLVPGRPPSAPHP